MTIARAICLDGNRRHAPFKFQVSPNWRMVYVAATCEMCGDPLVLDEHMMWVWFVIEEDPC